MNLQEMRELSAFQLAGFADCGMPDSADSAGAQLLTGVARDLAERLEWVRESGGPASWAEIVEVLEADGSLHEIADAAPDVYTHTRWLEFVDLAAYQEDVTELGEVDGNDLTGSVAGVALYVIAERLVRALVDELPAEEEVEEEDATAPTDEDRRRIGYPWRPATDEEAAAILAGQTPAHLVDVRDRAHVGDGHEGIDVRGPRA